MSGTQAAIGAQAPARKRGRPAKAGKRKVATRKTPPVLAQAGTTSAAAAPKSDKLLTMAGRHLAEFQALPPADQTAYKAIVEARFMAKAA